MNRALLLLLTLSVIAGAEETRAFVEIEAPRSCYAGEPVRLVLRIGIDRDWFKKHAVQMFQKRLMVPVHLHAPWLEKLAGTTCYEPRESGDLSLVLNDHVIRAPRGEDRMVAGRAYTILEIERTCVPTDPGELALSAPRLRYAYATQFVEDFVQGRRPKDRKDALIDGKAHTLTVKPLPAEGRPDRFGGAVGSFLVSAEASPRTLDTGAVMKLALRIKGQGNLTLFATPRLALDGFHVYGTTDDRSAPRRTITYDLAPLRAVNAVPAVPFSFFDPKAGAYRTVRTEPIPLEVRPGAQATQPAPRTPEPDSSVPFYLAIAALLLLALRALLMLRRRRDLRHPAHDAVAQFTQRAEEDIAEAFTGYLAARLDCPAASVIGPDLPARLIAAGVPEELATEASKLSEDLVAARYGGAVHDDRTKAAVHECVSGLERCFGSARA